MPCIHPGERAGRGAPSPAARYGWSSAKTTWLSSGPVHRRERQVLRAARPARRRRQDRPATHDGSDGSGRDQRTGTSPILGRRSFPPVSTLNRAPAVNQMACRRSLPDRNRAGRPSAPSPCRRRRRRSPVRGVQVRQGLLEHHGRYRTGPGPLRGALAAVSRAGRRAPPVQRQHIEHGNGPA